MLPLLVALADAPASTHVGDATEVVVIGGSLPQPPGEAAYDVATIDRDRLSSTASNRVEDVLRDVAGFAQFRRSDSRSAQPTSQGATLRGLGGNASSRALVTLDGVPFIDPFGGYVSFSAVDPQRLGLVRVTRGGGSGVAGPGALAGTIELTSASPGDLAPLWGDIASGSRSSVDAHAGASGAMAGGFAFVSGSYAQGDGFRPITASSRGPIDGRAPYEQASVAARAVIPVAPDVELQGSALGFADHRTRALPGTANDTKGADASLRLVARGRWGVDALAYLQARTFSAGFASANAARTAAAGTLDQYGVPSTGVGGRIEVRPPTGDRVQLRLGADARRLVGESDELYSYAGGLPTRGREAGGRTLTLGGFADASAEAGDVTLTAGARIDRWRIDDGFLNQRLLATQAPLTATRYPTRTGWRPTARGGAAWRPGGSAITLRGAAYLGWRLPTLNELFRQYRVGTDAVAANAGLRPERLRGLDGGVDYNPLPNLHVAATGFANRLSGAIANVTMGAGPGTFPQVGFVTGRYQVRENLRAIVSRGAELDARLGIGDWRLSASYAYTDARVSAPGLPLDGKRPAEAAKHQASATIGWAPALGPALSTTLRYAGPQFDDDLETVRLKSAVTLDMVASVPLARGFVAVARAENIGNARVEAAISSGVVERATPRTLWIGLRYGERGS
ncbi:TonB-dependent receptor [Sphingomonas sp.]|uniref:TonB-dependent receptor n=1 Tax=Sphingomonas sp. TaxID=28214 RepID=UPI003AFFF71F